MFKLLELNITNHKYFGDLPLKFVNEGEESNGAYITLIIGPNGTGKSQILSLILEIFNFISAYKRKEKLYYKFDYNFSLIYIIDNNKIRLYNIDGKIKAESNKQATGLKELPNPSKFLASAINLTDRYPNLTTGSKLFNQNYQYLGVRSTSNNAFTSSHSKNIVDSLSEAISRKIKLDNLKILFDQLDLQPILSIEYKAGRMFHLFLFEAYNGSSKELKSELWEYYQKYIKQQRTEKNVSYRLQKYERILNDDSKFDAAINFINSNFEIFRKQRKNQISYSSRLNFSSNNSIENFTQDIVALKALIDLEILEYDEINLLKIENSFHFIEASSGEYHLLTSFLGIYSKIENNSIILIDEPEISLHPNWQMRYMEILTKIFKDFRSCHFIIASHSHFLVSDLPATKSSILSLMFNVKEKVIESKLLENNTFGWTPENILYNIFNVATVRNHYFEMDLRKLLKLISDNSQNYTEINRLINKFENFEILPEDPLRIVINKAKDYLNQNEL